MEKQKRIITKCEIMGLDSEKILNAVDKCIIAMGDLTIRESKIAMEHLDHTLEKMYKRDPDTLIQTIQPLR